MNLAEIDEALRPALVTTATVAAITNQTASSIYAAIARGDVEATRVGRKFLIFSAPIREELRLPPVEAVAA